MGLMDMLGGGGGGGGISSLFGGSGGGGGGSSGLTALGYGLGYTGASGSGFGNMMTNANNQAAKKELNYRAGFFEEQGRPTGEALTAGYAPGGDIRKSWIDSARGDTYAQMGKDADTFRGNAWRYGGSASPIAQQRWYDYRQGAGGKFASTVNDLNARADAAYANMLTSNRVQQWQKDKPEVLTSDPYGWAWSSITGLGNSITGGTNNSTGSDYNTLNTASQQFGWSDSATGGNGGG